MWTRKRKLDSTTSAVSISSITSDHFPLDLVGIINDYSGIHTQFEVVSWATRTSWIIDPLLDKGQVVGLIGGDLENWEKGQEDWLVDIPSWYQPMVSAWIVSPGSFLEQEDTTVVAEELVIMQNGTMIELMPTDEDEGFETLAVVGQAMLNKECTLQTNKGLCCDRGNILLSPKGLIHTKFGETQVFHCLKQRVVLTDSGKVSIGGELIRSIDEKVYGMDAMWWEKTQRLILFLTCLKRVLLLEIYVFERFEE
jgi:hypothetical protein